MPSLSYTATSTYSSVAPASSAPPPQSTNKEPVVTKRGYILKKDTSKKSSSRKWINVFGVSYKAQLFFYKDNPSQKRQLPITVINLYQSFAQVIDYKDRQFVLSLTGPDYEYLLQAVDDGDRGHWVTALNEESRGADRESLSFFSSAPSFLIIFLFHSPRN